MQQASRIALIGLLALMQLFAPLVHAHTGGGRFSGAVHVPGLEYLGLPTGTFAQAPAGLEECQDVIVMLAPGLKNQGDHAIPSPDPEHFLSAVFSLVIGSQVARTAFPPPGDAPPLQAIWLKPSPRAPPRLG